MQASASLSTWLEYLQQLHPHTIELGLERIKPLAKELGLIHFPCPVITVAGTNGKGSVVRLLESIYRQAGYQTAIYTSPHLIRFTERLRINDKELDEKEWARAFEVIEQARGETSLTFFEFTTLAALWLCSSFPVEVIILEVGMGGRLDAVNVVESDVAVITSIGLDHQQWLGETREAIAREKVGIVRSGKPVVCAEEDPPLSLLEEIDRKKSRAFYIHQDFFIQPLSPALLRWEEKESNSILTFPYPPFKLSNIAAALMVVHLLGARLPLSWSNISDSMSTVTLPGRQQKFEWERGISCWLDVAHNWEAVAYLAQNLQKEAVLGKTVAVFTVLEDKNLEEILRVISSSVQLWYVPELAVERARPATEVVKVIRARYTKHCYNFPSVEQAFKQAVARCEPEDRLLVFGSFYVVGEVMKFLPVEIL